MICLLPILAQESARVPSVGALTLEPSPAARAFAFFVSVADDRARREAVDYPSSARALAVYDQELSDSFTRHDPTREPAASQEDHAAQPRVAFTADAPARRPTDIESSDGTPFTSGR